VVVHQPAVLEFSSATGRWYPDSCGGSPPIEVLVARQWTFPSVSPNLTAKLSVIKDLASGKFLHPSGECFIRAQHCARIVHISLAAPRAGNGHRSVDRQQRPTVRAPSCTSLTPPLAKGSADQYPGSAPTCRRAAPCVIRHSDRNYAGHQTRDFFYHLVKCHPLILLVEVGSCSMVSQWGDKHGPVALKG
jgi:hypothetical protein